MNKTATVAVIIFTAKNDFGDLLQDKDMLKYFHKRNIASGHIIRSYRALANNEGCESFIHLLNYFFKYLQVRDCFNKEMRPNLINIFDD